MVSWWLEINALCCQTAQLEAAQSNGGVGNGAGNSVLEEKLTEGSLKRRPKKVSELKIRIRAVRGGSITNTYPLPDRCLLNPG